MRLGLYLFQPPCPIWKFSPNFYVMKSVRKPLKVSCCSDSFIWMYLQTCIDYDPAYFNKNFQWYLKKMTNVWFIKYLFSKKNLEKKSGEEKTSSFCVHSHHFKALTSVGENRHVEESRRALVWISTGRWWCQHKIQLGLKSCF